MTPDGAQYDVLTSDKANWRDYVPVGLVVLGGLISTWLIWQVTRSLPLTGGMAAGGLLVAAVIQAWQMKREPLVTSGLDTQDWTLVRTIADVASSAVAITDRNGRLVCANDIYCDWFSGPATPPALPVDAPTVALIGEVGRTAWRDGEGAIAGFRCGGRHINGRVTRIGRNADHLLWQWEERRSVDMLATAAAQLTSMPGRLLGEAGVMAALVTASGR